jgi:dTDP-4-amino-4,6-dideoxygalactose transaminase
LNFTESIALHTGIHMMVQFLDLRRQHQEIAEEVTEAIARVLKSGAYILGQEVETFEREWAHFCGVSEAAGTASGTDALTLALLASGAVRPNAQDEVITSTLTAAYTALAILNAGAVPVFADIDPHTYTLDPESIEKVITPRTRAILPVHLYGQMADMKTIGEIASRYRLTVIEDAAQAHGSYLPQMSAGAHSLAAAFSFYPTKNLGAAGDGGAVVSNDAELIERVKILRQGGHVNALQKGPAGRNSRLDEIQAALLRVKLRHLKKWNDWRRQLAHLYQERLRGCPHAFLPQAPGAPSSHVYHLYVIQHPERTRLRNYMAKLGIETMIHYPYLLHQQALFKRKEQISLPVAENVLGKILSLPLYPQLSAREVEAVCDAIMEFES